MEPSPSTARSEILPIEIGSLSASSPNESQFFGSSSGVFFVNTVFRAFAASKQGLQPPANSTPQTDSPSQVLVNDCIADRTDEVLHATEQHEEIHDNTLLASKSYGISALGLGHPPNVHIAKDLIVSYFEKWHPLFPFLHGPTILDEIELFYSDDYTPENSTHFQIQENTRRCIVFQCLFNIAALDRPDIPLSPESKIDSSASLLSCLSVLSLKHDTPSLQAQLAAQLYLMSVMSLQAASTVGGMLIRNIFHAGFHRCPARYVQLSGYDCDIRKRIFWCVYSVDRYLSQALGHPVSMQDTDIDVCIPGTKELHKPVPILINKSQNPETEALLHLPNGHRGQIEKLIGRSAPSSNAGHVSQPDSTELRGPGSASLLHPIATSKNIAEGILAHYVGYCRVTGHVLDLFHKSIPDRQADIDSVFGVTSEVHAWWNGLPLELQEYGSFQNTRIEGTSDSTKSLSYNYGPFFTIIYQQLILLINRPFLSLDPTKAAFKSSLQTCIAAGRTILSTLKQVASHNHWISLPGILSSTWMSGLVIAFACELNIYPLGKGTLEIQSCLQLLDEMGKRWKTARHCHSILEILLADLQTSADRGSNTATDASNGLTRVPPHTSTLQTPQLENNTNYPNKRRRFNVPENERNSQSNSLNQQQSPLQEQQFALNDLDRIFDNAIMQEINLGQPNEIQLSDIFGHVSWEALFDGNMGDTGSSDFR